MIIRRLWLAFDANRIRIARLSRETGWILVGQAAVVLAQLLLVRVLTEYLAPEEFGRLALGMVAAMLIGQTAMVIVQGINRFYTVAAECGDLGNFRSASISLLGKATIITIAAWLIFFCYLWKSDLGSWMGLAASLLCFAILAGWNSAMNGVQAAARQRAVVAFHGSLDAWLRVGLVLLMMHAFGATSTMAVIAYIFAIAITVVSQSIFLGRLMPPGEVNHDSSAIKEWEKKIWQFSWPFALWGGVTWAQQSSDRWALEWFATLDEVGLYAVVFQLGCAPISTLSGLAMQLLAPILYQRAGDAADLGRNAGVHRLVVFISVTSLALTGFGVLMAVLFHEWLFWWLTGPNFRSYSYMLPWAVLAGGLFAAGQNLSLKFMSENKTSQLISLKIGTALIGIVANMLGALWGGAMGVLYGLVVFASTYILSVLALYGITHSKANLS